MEDPRGVVVGKVRRVEQGRRLAESNPYREQYPGQDSRERKPEDEAVDHGRFRAPEGDRSFLDPCWYFLDRYLCGPEDVREHYDGERDRSRQGRVAPIEVDDERQEAYVTQDDRRH